ncbi:MAG: FAD-binding protein [Acidimicrobiales bacterium]
MTAEHGQQAEFDEEVDVVVVGIGAAGSVAAIQAAEHGARVIALDRWGRGGASARSGGVVYAGGGTPQQLAAGFHDDADLMEQYLALEEGVPVDDARLDRFCDRSLEDLAWLEEHGVEFPMGFDGTKAVVPVDDSTGLYFSGNEKHYDRTVPAVARGHRVAGTGMSGHDLVSALHRAADRAGVDVRSGVCLVGLLQDRSGRVVGVEALVLSNDPLTRAVHGLSYRLLDVMGALARRVPPGLVDVVQRFERSRGRVLRIGARFGVVLATGGFSYNHELVAAHAPAYKAAMPLGTPGDDGSGILLAQGIGAGVRMMDRCGASRFIAPPVAFCGGVLVDERGERVCDESLYAATLSDRIAEHDSRAWLIVDADTRRRVRDQIRSATRLRTRGLRELVTGRANHVIFPRLFGSINLYLNRRAAPGIEALAERCGISPTGLSATIDAYNDAARQGRPDAMGKAAELVRPVEEPPFAAIPCHLDSQLFPAPCITLGGLDVDGDQRVRQTDGSTIPGLFGVGRCAAGVASRSYVSGLSLADCVFSGRNAGLALATPVRASAGTD